MEAFMVASISFSRLEWFSCLFQVFLWDFHAWLNFMILRRFCSVLFVGIMDRCLVHQTSDLASRFEDFGWNPSFVFELGRISIRLVLVGFLDAKSAPHAKHTASRINWLNTRGPGVRIRNHASQISLKLTKDENG
jgi:hypothetical protein